MSEKIHNSQSEDAEAPQSLNIDLWDMSDAPSFRQESEKPQLPEIKSTYEPSEEDKKKIDFFVDSIDRGERSIMYRGQEKTTVVSDYLDVYQEQGIDKSDAISQPLKEKMWSFLTDLALVDATHGKVLDGSEESRKYCKTLQEILDYSTSNEATDQEKAAIDNLISTLGDMGNAMSVLLFRSQELPKEEPKTETRSRTRAELEAAFDDYGEEDSSVESEQEKTEHQREIDRLIDDINMAFEAIKKHVNIAEEDENRLRHFERQIDDVKNARTIDTDVIRGILKHMEELSDELTLMSMRISRYNEDIVVLMRKGADSLEEDLVRRYASQSNTANETVEAIRKKANGYREYIQQTRQYVRRLEGLA